MEFLKTIATGQVALWYSDYIDYKYVLQEDMISKQSDDSFLPDSPFVGLSWLRTTFHEIVWLSCFHLFLWLHHMKSIPNNKIKYFWKQKTVVSFIFLLQLCYLQENILTTTNKRRAQKEVLRIKGQSFWALYNHNLSKTLNKFCFSLFSSFKRK